jgi:hypothetical protein
MPLIYKAITKLLKKLAANFAQAALLKATQIEASLKAGKEQMDALA